MENKRLMLIADDIEMNHDLFHGLFEDGYDFLDAYDGEQALELMRENSDAIHVMMLDLVMPKKNGFEVLEQIRDDEVLKKIPVIVVTAEGTTEHEIRALNLGAMDLVSSPLEPLIVKKRVTNIVNRIDYDRLEVRNKMLEERSKEDKRYRAIQLLSKTIVGEYDIETRENFYSKNINEHFDGDYENGKSLETVWAELNIVTTEDLPRFRAFIAAAKADRTAGDTAKSVLLRLKNRQGERQWYRLTSVYYDDEGGGSPKLFLTINNINADIEYQRQINKNLEVIQLITDNINCGIKVSNYDDAYTFHYVHDNLCKLLGYSRREFADVTENSSLGLVYPADREETKRRIDKLLSFGDEYHCEYRIEKKDGELMWAQETGRKFVDSDGMTRINSVITDITPLKNANEALRYQAEFDTLTDLYNKETFYKKAALMLMRRSGAAHSVLCIDIDRFKVINDLYGTAAGDKLLCYLGEKLKSHVDFSSEVVGRIGADIFAICAVADEGRIDRLIEAVSRELADYPLQFKITAAYGIYEVCDIDLPVNFMCDRALLAIESIKGNYLKRAAVFEESLRSRLIKEQHLVNEMNAAITEEQFVIYFQPQYDHIRGCVCGAEALVRWVHPQRGMIAPCEFIPVFEKNGYISIIDEYVWEKTCKQIKRWLKEGTPVVPISVNISRVDIIYNPSMCELLQSLVKKYDIPIELFRLEITESAYADKPELLIETVEKLRGYGFTVEMDDFGSGYSSLNTLKDVPVNILKIDLKFLAGSNSDGRSGSIMTSIVRMAKRLHLGIIAEGVETKEQADFLASIGCTVVQGYYYSRPIPIFEFEKLVKSTACDSKANGTETLASSDTANELWNYDAQTSLLFNGLLGAAGIFETCGEKLEGLRLNNDFFAELKMSRERLEQHGSDLLSLLSETDRAKINELLSAPTLNENPISLVVSLQSDDGEEQKIRLKMHLLSVLEGRKLIFVNFINLNE